MQNVGARAVIEGLGQFEAGMASMDRHIARVGRTSETTAGLTRGANLALTALAGATTTAFGVSVQRAAEFEKAMAGIAAVSGASKAQLDQLAEAARTAGGRFGFLAVESAGGIEALTKAGVSMSDILGGALPAALTLAAAGSVEVKDAAEIAANAMNQFSLKGSDMAHIADVVAGAANASAIDVRDFQLSLQQVGAVASVTGQTFDSTAQAIAVMGSAGIKSSDAGTSLKTMLLNLQPQADKAKEVMEALGLVTADGANAFFDATGKAKSFRDIAGVLQTALSGLTEQQKLAALQVIFGSDATRAAAVLAREGAAGFDEMAKAMGKVSAEDVAAKRLDSLIGDLSKLKVALDNVATAAGKETTPALRQAVQALTEVISKSDGAATFLGGKLSEAMVSATRLAVILVDSLNRLDFTNLFKAANLLSPLLGVVGAVGNIAGNIGGILSVPFTARSSADIAAGVERAFLVDEVRKMGLTGGPDFSAEERSLRDTALAAQEAAEAQAKAAAEAAKLKKEQDDAAEKARILAEALAGAGGKGGGGAAGAAKAAETAFQEYGVSLDTVRRIMIEAKRPQEEIDSVILRLGGTLLDTGEIAEAYGQTFTRLAAIFNAVGLDGAALVAVIKQQQDATNAAREAEKAAAEERERIRREEEEALKRRQAALASTLGTSALNVLGGIRSRGAGTGEQAAADFEAAIDGFERLTKAQMDTSVASDVMAARLARLSGAFGVLSGDDRASAGAVTDGIRRLQEQFAAGEIQSDEFLAGLREYAPELARLAGEVDKIWQAWQREAEAEKEALKAERLEIHASAIRNWSAQLQLENVAVIRSWNERADAARRAAEAEAAVGRAQMEAGRNRLLRGLAERLQRTGFIDANTLGTVQELFGISGTEILALAQPQGLRLPSPQVVQLPPSGSGTAGGGGVTNNYIVNASYADTQSPASVRTDLEALIMLAGR